MPPINVTVNWPDGSDKPQPDQDPILVPASNGATVIKWLCGTNVASVTISGLNASVFTPSGGTGTPLNPFSTTDANRDSSRTDYTYTITATHPSGRTASHDPKIENGG